MKKIIAIVLSLVMCLALLAGCGGGDSTQTDASSAPQQSQSGNKSNKKNSEASSSDIVLENIPTASEGDVTGSGGVSSDAFKDIVAQVTEISEDSIFYKVCKAKNAEQAIDFSVIDKDDYEVTSETGGMKFDESTPFYLRNDGMWYQSSSDQLEVGNTIVIAINEGSQELEGIIILD